MTSPQSIFFKVMSDQDRFLLPHVGIKKLLKQSSHYTGLENRYYSMLREIGITFVPQYPLNGRFYDAYIPSKKILLEFDGSFWHPKTRADAKYSHQKKNYKVDILKNKYAKENGLRLFRIREDEPITSSQLKKLIEEGSWD